jgi:hypothetical protein
MYLSCTLDYIRWIHDLEASVRTVTLCGGHAIHLRRRSLLGRCRCPLLPPTHDFAGPRTLLGAIIARRCLMVPSLLRPSFSWRFALPVLSMVLAMESCALSRRPELHCRLVPVAGIARPSFCWGSAPSVPRPMSLCSPSRSLLVSSSAGTSSDVFVLAIKSVDCQCGASSPASCPSCRLSHSNLLSAGTFADVLVLPMARKPSSSGV